MMQITVNNTTPIGARILVRRVGNNIGEIVAIGRGVTVGPLGIGWKVLFGDNGLAIGDDGLLLGENDLLCAVLADPS